MGRAVRARGGGGGGAGGAGGGGAAATADGSVRPLIYVYDMPPRFTSWLAAYRKGDWSRDHWYGVDVMLHQQLLRERLQREERARVVGAVLRLEERHRLRELALRHQPVRRLPCMLGI